MSAEDDYIPVDLSHKATDDLIREVRAAANDSTVDPRLVQQIKNEVHARSEEKWHPGARTHGGSGGLSRSLND